MINSEGHSSLSSTESTVSRRRSGLFLEQIMRDTGGRLTDCQFIADFRVLGRALRRPKINNRGLIHSSYPNMLILFARARVSGKWTQALRPWGKAAEMLASVSI